VYTFILFSDSRWERRRHLFFWFWFWREWESRARMFACWSDIWKTKGKRRKRQCVYISLSWRRFFFLFFLRSLSRSFVVFFLSVRPTVYIEVAPPLVNNNATRLHTPQPIVLSFFPLSYRSSSRKKNRSQTPPRDGGDPRLTTLFYTEIERPLKMVKICFTAISLSRWYSIFCWCWCFCFVFLGKLYKECGEWVERKSEDVFFYSISRR